MIIHTGCHGCGRSLAIDIRHKEPYATPGQATPVANAVCEYCRTEMTIAVTITPK